MKYGANGLKAHTGLKTGWKPERSLLTVPVDMKSSRYYRYFMTSPPW